MHGNHFHCYQYHYDDFLFDCCLRGDCRRPGYWKRDGSNIHGLYVFFYKKLRFGVNFLFFSHFVSYTKFLLDFGREPSQFFNFWPWIQFDLFIWTLLWIIEICSKIEQTINIQLYLVLSRSVKNPPRALNVESRNIMIPILACSEFLPMLTLFWDLLTRLRA